MILITGTGTLITWTVTVVARSYMRKNGGKVPGQGSVGASWRQGSLDEWFVVVYLMASPLHPWWRSSWTGHCRSKLEVGYLSAVHQRSSHGFPSNKFANVRALMYSTLITLIDGLKWFIWIYNCVLWWYKSIRTINFPKIRHSNSVKINNFSPRKKLFASINLSKKKLYRRDLISS